MDASTGLAAIAVLLSILSVVKGYGKDQGGNQEWRTSVMDTLKRMGEHHADHYQHAKDDQEHFKDAEMHWTSRERDGLTQVLKDLSVDVKELLRQSKKA